MGFAEGFGIGCEREKRQEYCNIFGLSNVMDGVVFIKMWMTAEEWVYGKIRGLF